VGLAWSEDRQNYTSSNIATGRVSHARQVMMDDDPDEKRYNLVPQVEGWM
jgi:hypothetical protein